MSVMRLLRISLMVPRRPRAAAFILLMGAFAAVVLLLQGEGQTEATGGWAYRYGRWVERMDPYPGVKDLVASGIAAGGPGVVMAGSGRFCRPDSGVWSGVLCMDAGVLLGIGVDGQVTWAKAYENVSLKLVKPYESGSFLVAGGSRIMQVDGNGNVLWTVAGLGVQDNFGACGAIEDVEPLPAGGFAVLTENHCIFRLGADGSLLWAKKLDSRLWPDDIAPYGDNIAVAGTYAPCLACGSSYNFYGFIGILKGDGSGFEWLRYYHWEDPVPRSERRQWTTLRRIFPQSDGGIIAFGSGGLVRVNADGLVQWWRILDSGAYISEVAPYYLGGFIVAGHYYQPPESPPCGTDIFLARLNAAGNVVASRVLGRELQCDMVGRNGLAVSASDVFVLTSAQGNDHAIIKTNAGDFALEGFVRPGGITASPASDPFPNDEDEESESKLSFGLLDPGPVRPFPITMQAFDVNPGRQAPWGHAFLEVMKRGSLVQERTQVTSSPEGIDCGDDCWEPYPEGSEVTLSLRRTLRNDWVPYAIGCDDPSSEQWLSGSTVTLRLERRHWTPWWPPDVTCQVYVVSNTIGVRLRAEPSTLMLRRLEGSDRPAVSITLTLTVDGQPVPGVAVRDIAILDVRTSTYDQLDVTRAGVLVLPEPRVTDQSGRYVFQWLPPQASYFEGATLPVSFRFGACVDPFHPYPTQYGLNYSDTGCTSGWLVDVSGTAEVTGRVLQRHAGAVDDPDGDGVRPVAGALVSTSPTFPPDRTVETDQEGRYRLEVEAGTSGTLYVRKPSGEGYDRWTQTRLPFEVEAAQTGQTVELEDVYLAHLRVAGQMLESRLPALQSILGDTAGVQAHRHFVRSLLDRAPPSYPGRATTPWEEEALRRLSLAEWAALNGAQVMYRTAECGVTLFWDASLGIVTALFNKAVDSFLQAAFKKAELIWQERWILDPEQVPELVQQLRAETQRLNAVQLAIAEFIASLQDKIFTRHLEAAIQVLNDQAILARVPNSLVLSHEPNRWAAFLNEVLSFVQRVLSEYDLAKAVYDAMKAIDQAASEATSWPGVVETISRVRDQLLTPALNALESIEQWLRDFASSPARDWVDRLLVDSAEWARRGEFAQTADSYARARELVTHLTHELSQWWNSINSVCENIQTWVEFARNAVGGLQIAAALGSLVTGGATMALMPMLEAIDWTLLGSQGALGLAFALVGAQPNIHPVGDITKTAVHAAFDKVGQDGQLVVKVHSPVHLLAVDRQGRTVGMDGQGRQYLQVPGAAHSRGGTVELVDGEETAQLPETLVLPQEHGPYTLLLFGTGNGSYTLEVQATQEDDDRWIWAEVGQRQGTIGPGDVHVLTITQGQGGTPVLGEVQQGLRGFNHLILVVPVSPSVTLRAGDVLPVAAVLADGQGRHALPPTACLQWFSNNEQVARAQPLEGTNVANVVAFTPGSASITASCNGAQASIQVTVVAGPPAAVQVEVDGRQRVMAGTEVRLRARVLDSGDSPVAGANVQFRFLGEDAGIRTTDADGHTDWLTVRMPSAPGPAVVSAIASWSSPPAAPIGHAVLYVVPSAPAVPEYLVIFRERREVGRLDVPSSAFAPGTAPIVSATALGPEAELPPPPTGRTNAITVAISLLDAATADPLQPQSPLRLTLLYEGSPSQAGIFRLQGDTWQPLDTQATTGSLFTSIDQPGVYALMEVASTSHERHTLTVRISGLGAGTVASSPPGINCGGDCSEVYDAGTVVTLTAIPAQGSTFAGWSGACSGRGATATVTMNSDKTCTARFELVIAPPPPPPPPPPGLPFIEVSVPSPTGTGELIFRASLMGGPLFLQVAPYTGTPPVPPPAGYELPHGLYSLRVEGIAPRASVTIQVTLPSPAPIGTVWLKLIGNSWVALPVGDDDGDNVITITLTDGGQGDADGVADGVITDPGGPAIPLRVVALWGDVDCDGKVDAVDALKVLRHVVGLDVSQQEPCADIGSTVSVDGTPRLWGDVDGDGVVGAVDALKLLRHVVRLRVAQAPGTPAIGREVEVSLPRG